MKKDSERLYSVIGRLYDAGRGARSVSPATLATQGMVEIGFAPDLHDLGYEGCHCYMRQIAREFCRDKADPVARAEAAAMQADMFPDTLQERYPIRHLAGEEPQYILLDHLKDDDIDFNVARMRRASFALQRHSDALEAFKRSRRVAA